ncbi:hypothetical protein BE61_08400 [Bradyrhizobium elkanii USDA 61]|nr:hypothetical protein BE61_08400 [Bradyrhizobium elkanii USDA 61]
MGDARLRGDRRTAARALRKRSGTGIAAGASGYHLERFRAKWIPVRVKKTRQNKNLEPRSDSIGTGKL